MKKYRHKKNLPLLLARIILFCCCFFLIDCTIENVYKRDLPFDKGWETQNGFSFKKNFELDLSQGKVYLLQLPKANSITELCVNNTLVSGHEHDGRIYYNITDCLGESNVIEMEVDKCRNNTLFLAKLHCLNKIYISEVDIQLYEIENTEKSLLVNVKVKNAFNTEKQGYLKYYLFSENNQKILQRETPVFIEGNAENIYSQQIDISNRNEYTGTRTIVCKVFVEGKEIDGYANKIELNE